MIYGIRISLSLFLSLSLSLPLSYYTLVYHIWNLNPLFQQHFIISDFFKQLSLTIVAASVNKSRKTHYCDYKDEKKKIGFVTKLDS